MLNRMHIHAFILLTGCVLLLMPDPVQSSSAEIYKEYTDSAIIGKNRIININSKKANLKITRWDKQMVWVKTRITFQNKDPEMAGKELEYSRFNFLKTVSGINMSNFFSLPPGTEIIQSIVTVDYQVFLPEKVNLVINNEYGSCSVDDLEAFVNLNNKYGDIRLNRVKGQFRVFATLCDIQMNNFSGNFEIFSSNSDIILKNINGQVKVNNKVGTIILEPGEGLDFLTVNSTYSEIDVMMKEINRFNYELTAENATVELDPGFRQFPFQVNSKEKVVYRSEDNYRLIEILTTNNAIKLHKNEKCN